MRNDVIAKNPWVFMAAVESEYSSLSSRHVAVSTTLRALEASRRELEQQVSQVSVVRGLTLCASSTAALLPGWAAFAGSAVVMRPVLQQYLTSNNRVRVQHHPPHRGLKQHCCCYGEAGCNKV